MTPDIHALEGRGFTALNDKKRSRPYIGLLPLYTSYLLLIHKQSAVLID